MKKINLLFCASFMAMGAFAQNGVQILVGPDVKVEYQVVNLSPNGRWACGNVNDGDGRGFVWDLVNDKITQLAPIGQTAPVLAVSNDGTLVGLFTTDEATANGASVEVGGYYKDGRWHYLPGCGLPNGISDNGKYIAGITQQGNKYHAATWTLDGEMTIWGESHIGGGYDVSNDGQLVVGYAYHPIKNNRTPALWTINPETGVRDSVLLDYYNIGPFSVAWDISPDGTKISADKVIYDVTTKETKRIDFTGIYGYEFIRVTNSGNVVGRYSTGMYDLQRAAYVVDGKILDLQKYLEENYNIDFKGWSLIQCVAVSEDEKIFAVNAYDTAQVPHPMIINLNANVTNPAPTSLQVAHLEGTDVCRLTWEAPLANKSGVKGYKVWRNGSLLSEVANTDYIYYDRAVANGEHEYAITAVYEGSESAQCLPVSVTVTDYLLKAPRNLNAIQAGIRDVRLSWKAPLANRPTLKHGAAGMEIAAFGGGDYNFEQAVRFDAADLAVYNKQVTDISFYPMTRQNSWSVNFYTAKDTTLFATRQLDATNLVYGVENTVRLAEPVNLPEGEDIYVGIYVDVTGFGGYRVLGAIFNTCCAGYTDLLRRQGEPAFMSLYENAMSDPEGAYEYPITFPIGICFGEASQLENNDVVSYKLYADGIEVGTTDQLKYRQKKVADGEHTFGVAAVYNNGAVTEPLNIPVTVTENKAAYKAITNPVLTVGADKTLTATWEAPVEDDETFITYAGDENAGGLAPSEADGYSCLLAAVYDQDNLGDYEGYLITDLKFFPTGDADFALVLQENGETVAEVFADRGVGYTLGMWNTLKLDTPVEIKSGAEYTMVVDVWQVTAGEAPLGMDNLPAFENESDLYSVDGGATYTSISTMTTSTGRGNWMMGLVIRSAETSPLPVTGYNVLIDRKSVADAITSTTYTHTQPLEDGTHMFRVDVIYEGVGTVTGSTKFIEMASGVEGVGLAPVTLESTDTQITVLGETVTGVKLFTTTGTLVTQAEGRTLGVTQLSSGVYVLVAVVDGQELTRKINIR